MFDYVTSLVFCQLILVVSQLFLEFVFVSDYLLRTEFYFSSFGVVKVVVKAIEQMLIFWEGVQKFMGDLFPHLTLLRLYLFVGTAGKKLVGRN